MRLPIPYSTIIICVCGICIAKYTVEAVARQIQTGFIVSCHLMTATMEKTLKDDHLILFFFKIEGVLLSIRAHS